jgi:hypothetical protein
MNQRIDDSQFAWQYPWTLWPMTTFCLGILVRSENGSRSILLLPDVKLHRNRNLRDDILAFGAANHRSAERLTPVSTFIILTHIDASNVIDEAYFLVVMNMHRANLANHLTDLSTRTSNFDPVMAQ